MWGELANSFQNGNYYLFAIMFLAFIGIVVVFERVIMLQLVYNIDFAKFLNNLKKMIASNDLERAMNLCKSISKTSLPKIALRALEASENDPTSVRGTIEEDTIEFLPRIENRIGFLPTLATLIMLVGILGTIDSLWSAFHSIDVLDTAKKQAAIATGVASSLNPTALGIIVCMLFLAGHQFLKGSAIKIVEHIHHGVAVLNNLLVPQEVAFVAAAPAMESHPQVDLSANEVQPAAKTATSEGPVQDAFDDASVEDIKDEEEII